MNPPCHSGPAERGPRVVVTLVHGTWPGAASWCQDMSPLCVALRRAFPYEILFKPFSWSGGNSLRARAKAAAGLRSHLYSAIVTWPRARHYVIAHSHGGNIALYALRDADLASRITGVVCLATPFLHVSLRDLGALSGWAAAALPIAITYSLIRLLNDHCEPCRAYDFVGLVLGLAALAISGFATRFWRTRTDRIVRALAFPALDSSRLLIVRSAGDEASAALGAAHLFSWLVGACWVRPTARLARLAQWITQRIARAAAASIYVRFRRCIIGVALIVCSEVLQPNHDTIAMVIGLPGMCIVGISAVALLIIAISRLTIALLRDSSAPMYRVSKAAGIGVFLVPLAIALGIALWPFGPEMMFVAMLLEISAETTPPGAWRVHYVQQVRNDRPHQESKWTLVPPLVHSRIYEDPAAIAVVRKWVARPRLRHSKPGRPDSARSECVTREYWERRGTSMTSALMRQIIALAREADPDLRVQYGRHYISMIPAWQVADTGNVRVTVGRYRVRVLIRCPLIRDIEAARAVGDLEWPKYNPRTSRYRWRLASGDLDSVTTRKRIVAMCRESYELAQVAEELLEEARRRHRRGTDVLAASI